MKEKDKTRAKLPAYGWLILFSVFIYGVTSLIAKSFPNLDLVNVLLLMKFIAVSSFVAMGGFYCYYFLTYGIVSDAPKVKKWHSKRIVALILTFFLVIVLALMIFTSLPAKESGVIIFGIILGTIYVIRGGSLPNWYIEFTQKFDFYTGGHVTADDNPSNLSPKIYLPIIFAAILIALIAYGIFIKGY